MKTPLKILTGVAALSFLDGFFTLGLSDGMYMLIGFTFIACIIWMWVEVNKS